MLLSTTSKFSPESMDSFLKGTTSVTLSYVPIFWCPVGVPKNAFAMYVRPHPKLNCDSECDTILNPSSNFNPVLWDTSMAILFLYTPWDSGVSCKLKYYTRPKNYFII